LLPEELKVLAPRIQKAALTEAVPKEDFGVTRLGDIAKSPLRLKDWLDLHIPLLIGPPIGDFEPTSGQRGTIVMLRGARFVAAEATSGHDRRGKRAGSFGQRHRTRGSHHSRSQ
jgi:hypothetical protein